jgi:hypothetical protein
VLSFLNAIDFRYLIWLFPFILLFHELEEWNILKWYKENYEDLPNFTNLSIRIWIFGLSIFGFISTAVCFYIPIISVSAFLLSLFILLTFQNGLQHLYWTIYFKKYAPGIVTSVLVVIPFDIYTFYRIIEEELLPIWFLLVIIIIIPGLIETFKAKNRMTKGIRSIHELVLKVVEWLEK